MRKWKNKETGEIVVCSPIMELHYSVVGAKHVVKIMGYFILLPDENKWVRCKVETKELFDDLGNYDQEKETKAAKKEERENQKGLQVDQSDQGQESQG